MRRSSEPRVEGDAAGRRQHDRPRCVLFPADPIHGRPRWRSHTITSVAYDKELADRIRTLLPDDAAVSEQAMFGGLTFLVGGNMAVAASGQGGVLVRVDPADSEQLMTTTTAVPMEMRGRAMRGWLRVSPDQVRTKRQLSRWVDLGVRYASSLPTKR